MRRWFVLVGLLVVGCGVSEPAPSPVSVEPTATVAPSASASMSQEELDAEAEWVFLASNEVRYRYELRGDFSGFPESELSQYMFPEYLALARSLYAMVSEKGWSTPDGAQPVVKYEPDHSMTSGGSEATLHVCTDTRPTPLVDRKGSVVSEGTLYESYVFFARDTDGRLKIQSERYEEVTECVL